MEPTELQPTGFYALGQELYVKATPEEAKVTGEMLNHSFDRLTDLILESGEWKAKEAREKLYRARWWHFFFPCTWTWNRRNDAKRAMEQIEG